MRSGQLKKCFNYILKCSQKSEYLTMGSSRNKSGVTARKIKVKFPFKKKKKYEIKKTVNSSNLHKDVNDPKLISRVHILKCLQNKCHVQVKDISYVLKGRHTVFLFEIPDWWYQSQQLHAFVDVNKEKEIPSDTDDDFDLKIVKTFSLAPGRHYDDVEDNLDVQLPNVTVSSENHVPMNLDYDSNVFHESNSLFGNGFIQSPGDTSNSTIYSHDTTDGGERCSTHSPNSDLKSIFSSPLLDSMLESEVKTLEDPESVAEDCNTDLSHIKYLTPTSQSSYVKTLKRALEERNENVTKLDQNFPPTEKIVKSNSTKKFQLTQKPVYDLSKLRTSLQKFHHTKRHRSTAITDILSGLPNVYLQKRTSYANKHKVGHSRCMLQNISLHMADFASSAYTEAYQQESASNSTLLMSNDASVTTKESFVNKNTRYLKRKRSNELKSSHCNNRILNELHLRNSQLSYSPSVKKKKTYLKDDLLESVSESKAHLASTAVISDLSIHELKKKPSISKIEKMSLSSHSRISAKLDKTCLKMLRKKVTSLQPLSLQAAVSKHFVYMARKHSSRKMLRKHSTQHFQELPVSFTRDVPCKGKRCHLKLRLSKHKLRWIEVQDGLDIVVSPEQYSVPDSTTMYDVCSATSNKKSGCARTCFNGKVPARTQSSKDSTSQTSISDNSSLSSTEKSVLLLRLSHSSDSSESGLLVKILSLCNWSEKVEEIINVIIESHNELSVMQRGKYLRTEVDHYVIEVLRVTAGQIIFGGLPQNIRQELKIPHWKFVSLVKISKRLEKRSNNTVNMDRSLNFVVAIEDILQLDKEMSSNGKKYGCKVDVKDVLLDNTETLDTESDKYTTDEEKSHNNTLNSSVINKLKSCNLKKLSRKIQNLPSQKYQASSSNGYEIDEIKQKFEVGRIGCLNKVTAPLFTQSSTSSTLTPASAPYQTLSPTVSGQLKKEKSLTKQNKPLPVSPNAKLLKLNPSQFNQLFDKETVVRNLQVSKYAPIHPKAYPVEKVASEKQKCTDALKNAPSSHQLPGAPVSYIAVPCSLAPFQQQNKQLLNNETLHSINTFQMQIPNGVVKAQQPISWTLDTKKNIRPLTVGVQSCANHSVNKEGTLKSNSNTSNKKKVKIISIQPKKIYPSVAPQGLCIKPQVMHTELPKKIITVDANCKINIPQEKILRPFKIVRCNQPAATLQPICSLKMNASSSSPASQLFSSLHGQQISTQHSQQPQSFLSASPVFVNSQESKTPPSNLTSLGKLVVVPVKVNLAKLNIAEKQKTCMASASPLTSTLQPPLSNNHQSTDNNNTASLGNCTSVTIPTSSLACSSSVNTDSSNVKNFVNDRYNELPNIVSCSSNTPISTVTKPTFNQVFSPPLGSVQTTRMENSPFCYESIKTSSTVKSSPIRHPKPFLLPTRDIGELSKYETLHPKTECTSFQNTLTSADLKSETESSVQNLQSPRNFTSITCHPETCNSMCPINTSPKDTYSSISDKISSNNMEETNFKTLCIYQPLLHPEICSVNNEDIPCSSIYVKTQASKLKEQSENNTSSPRGFTKSTAKSSPLPLALCLQEDKPSQKSFKLLNNTDSALDQHKTCNLLEANCDEVVEEKQKVLTSVPRFMKLLRKPVHSIKKIEDVVDVCEWENELEERMIFLKGHYKPTEDVRIMKRVSTFPTEDSKNASNCGIQEKESTGDTHFTLRRCKKTRPRSGSSSDTQSPCTGNKESTAGNMKNAHQSFPECRNFHNITERVRREALRQSFLTLHASLKEKSERPSKIAILTEARKECLGLKSEYNELTVIKSIEIVKRNTLLERLRDFGEQRSDFLILPETNCSI